MNIISLKNHTTNCYLIPVDNGWLMIDTGVPGSFSQLLQLLSHNKISITAINYLVITHFHPGHAGLTQNFRDLGTKLILHEYQIPYINRLNMMYKKNPRANYRDIVSGNWIVINDADSRDYLKTLELDGALISTPGHSDDSVSLVIDNLCAFTGDLPYIAPDEDVFDLVIEDSWDMVRRLGAKKIYPGHGEAYTIEGCSYTNIHRG